MGNLTLLKIHKLALYRMPKDVYNGSIERKKEEVFPMSAQKIRNLILAALMAALTTVATMMIRIPT
ncbi:MAG: hypothetical protein ACOYIE_08565, partial [Agathobaculum sp.]|uniref:hypothetical protein n=1 Tax=Agathobaculum sp. TaxID=2048138 RepID=UPI003D8A9B3C